MDGGLFRIADLKVVLTVGVTGLQGVHISPRHMIPPSVCPGNHVCPFIAPTCNSYL
jgi:hypothetical protein